MTVCRESYSITSTAKVLTHTADVAKLAHVSLNLIALARRTYMFPFDSSHTLQAVVLCYFLMHFSHGDKLFVFPIILVKGHEFDKANVKRLIFRQLDEIYELVFIEVSHGYNVEFDAF